MDHCFHKFFFSFAFLFFPPPPTHSHTDWNLLNNRNFDFTFDCYRLIVSLSRSLSFFPLLHTHTHTHCIYRRIDFWISPNAPLCHLVFFCLNFNQSAKKKIQFLSFDLSLGPSAPLPIQRPTIVKADSG